MHFPSLKLVVFLCLKLVFCAEQCDYLDQIKVEYTVSGNSTTGQKIISGCLSQEQFPKESVTAFYIYDSLPYLGKNSVANLPNLNVFSVYAKDLTEIEPGTFRNLPNLQTVGLRLGQLKEVFRNTFDVLPKLDYLMINNQQIDYIEDQAFANLKALKKVYFQYNNLMNWNREWFTNSTAVEELLFANNKIRILPRSAFAALPKLKMIGFTHNEISVIHKNAFKGLRHLQILALSYNRLKTINEDIFPNKLVIQSLFIQANYLNFLPNEVLRKISVRGIQMYGNPWKCPCLDRIDYWLYENNATSHLSDVCRKDDLPLCMYPKTYSRTCIETVDQDLTVKYRQHMKQFPVVFEQCFKPD